MIEYFFREISLLVSRKFYITVFRRVVLTFLLFRVTITLFY